MQEEKYVKLDDVFRVSLEAVGDLRTQEVLKKETPDFVRGALWEMSWAAIMINLNATQYIKWEE